MSMLCLSRRFVLFCGGLLVCSGVCVSAATYDATYEQAVEQALLGVDIAYDDVLDSTVTKGLFFNRKHHRSHKKPWTVVIYMAADNDLRGFAAANIKQMASIGSSEYVNIIIQLDIRLVGNNKVSRRYYVEKNKITHLNAHESNTQRMNSGDPRTLVSCCEWALGNYPADNYALVIWDHGTGCLEPGGGVLADPSGLFALNNESNRCDVDRSRPFLDWISCDEEQRKGVCWDSSTGNYISNNQFDQALTLVRNRMLGGHKFTMIAFDACLMSMIEVASMVKRHAHIMVGSEDAEIGTGWNYSKALSPFSYSAPTAETLARNIVQAYKATYSPMTDDYTQSAIYLDQIERLEDNVDAVAKYLLQLLSMQNGRTVKDAIKASANKVACTHFDEPSYVDLYHLYDNLLKNMPRMVTRDLGQGESIKIQIERLLKAGQEMIGEIVFASVAGKKVAKARGLSIYFPERNIHHSYVSCSFVRTTAWGKLLARVLSA